MNPEKSLSVNFKFKRIKSQNILNLDKSVSIGKKKDDVVGKKSSCSSLAELSENKVSATKKIRDEVDKHKNNYVFKPEKVINEQEFGDVNDDAPNRIKNYLTPIACTSYGKYVNFQISRIHKKLVSYPLVSKKTSLTSCLCPDYNKNFYKNSDTLDVLSGTSEDNDYISKESNSSFDDQIDDNQHDSLVKLENENIISQFDKKQETLKTNDSSVTNAREFLNLVNVGEDTKAKLSNELPTANGEYTKAKLSNEIPTANDEYINKSNISELNNDNKRNFSNDLDNFYHFANTNIKNNSNILKILKPKLVEGINLAVLYKPSDPIEFLANYLYKLRS